MELETEPDDTVVFAAVFDAAASVTVITIMSVLRVDSIVLLSS